MTNITASKSAIIQPYVDDIKKYKRMYQEQKFRADKLQDELSSLQFRLQDIAGDLGSMKQIAGKL